MVMIHNRFKKYEDMNIEDMTIESFNKMVDDIGMVNEDLHIELHKYKGILSKEKLSDRLIDHISDGLDSLTTKTLNSIKLTLNNYINTLKKRYDKYSYDIDRVNLPSEKNIEDFIKQKNKKIKLDIDLYERMLDYLKDNSINSKMMRYVATLSKDLDRKIKSEDFIFLKANRKVFSEYDKRLYPLGNGEIMLSLSKDSFELGTKVVSSSFEAIDLVPKIKEEVSLKDLNISAEEVVNNLDVKRVKKEIDREVRELEKQIRELDTLIANTIDKSEIEGFKSHYDYLHEVIYSKLRYGLLRVKASSYIVKLFTKG